MRVACVFIHHLAVQIALAKEPGLGGKPLIIGGLPFEIKPVVDMSSEAMACDVKVGMPLREALSHCPEAMCLMPDEAAYKEAFKKVLQVLDNFSPVVEIEKPGCAYIDVTGVENEKDFASELISSVFTYAGLRVSIGITDGKLFSLTAALMSKPEILKIVPGGDEEKFIEPLSINYLDCKPEVKERLRLLGIRFVRQLGDFTSEALLAQFGDDGLRLYQIAHGIDSSPLIPRKREDIINVSADLETTASLVNELLEIYQSILDEPFQQMRSRGKVCREVQVQIIFESGKSESKRLTFKENTSQVKVAVDRIKVWLESGAFSAPVTQVTLSIWLASDNGKRVSLWSEQNDKEQRLNHLVVELKKRFGHQPLKKVQEIHPDTIVPERRFGLRDIPYKG
ncbi:hypothetical protein ACFLYR_05705 [Chloroflexota bacterium]